MDDITSEIFHTKRKKLKKWWEQLSHLEQNLIISLIVVGTVLILIILVLLIQAAVTPKICTTRQCLIAASEIASRTDPTIDPCHDFYQFSCRKLNELNNKKNQLSVEQVENELIDILVAPSDDANEQLRHHKELFQMCLNKTEGEESFKRLKSILEELNGWPVTLGYDWRAGTFEWKNLVNQLRKKGLPYNMLISINLTPSPDTSNFMLHIQKPELPKIPQEYRHDYRKFMQEVAVTFGAERSRALNDMKRVLDFIIELGKLTDKWQKNEKHKLSDLQIYFNEVDWLDFLNGILAPTSSISLDDYVITPGHKYMHEFFNLINRTPKRVQANYILWMTVKEHLPILSERLKILQSNYAHLTETVNLSPERWHWQQCYNIIRKAFVSPPAEVVFSKKHLKEDGLNQIRHLAENVKKTLEMFLKETNWIHELTINKILDKLDNLAILQNTINDNGQIDFQPEGKFLDMYLTNVRNKFNYVYKQMHNDATRHYNCPVYSLEVTYLPQTNTLVLPIGSYFEDAPFYLNYGEMGAIIAHTLTRAMLTSTGDEQLWTLHYNESSRCIQDRHGADALDLIGVQLAYGAYRIWAYYHNEEDQLIGLNYKPNQLAWISSILGYCSLLNDQSGSLINGIVRNHPNFGYDFSCPWGSPMNPLRKCTLI